MKNFADHALAGAMSSLSSGDFPQTELDPDRDLIAELFGKRNGEEKVDELERELGIGRRKTNVDALKFHNKVFCPEDEQDKKLLNELLNDKTTYNIIMWKDNWTNHGHIRIFVIYSERLHKKPNAEKKEETGRSTESLSPP